MPMPVIVVPIDPKIRFPLKCANWFVPVCNVLATSTWAATGLLVCEIVAVR